MGKRLCLVFAAVLLLALSGCGGGDRDRVVITGPGFVGIDDSVAGTAPLLTVYFVDAFGPGRAIILSDPVSDGDIAFDPVRSVFTVSSNATPLFFGVDSSLSNRPEFRTFLTFPLDGFGERDIVPSGATITDATLELFVTEVSFAGIVPTFMDLVPYGILGAADFDAAFLDFRSLDFFSSDAGNFVRIDVTPLMQTAQALNLLDFQIRLSLDGSVAASGARVARPQAEQKKAERTVSPSSTTGERPARTPRAVGSPSGAEAERPTRSR